MKIVFATNNPNKLQEIRDILGERFEIVSLQDIGCHEDIPETGETLQENALLKAKYVAEHYGLDCFADDTGLEVEALHGAPGVHSARYAEGTDHNSEANMQKLLHELQDKENRKARFRTVIALLQHHKNQQEENVENAFAAPEIHYFEGRIDGIIAVSYTHLDVYKRQAVTTPQAQLSQNKASYLVAYNEESDCPM